MRILLVEDERRLANVVKTGLEEEGFAVDVAYDGEEGQYLAESESYDLIILDIMIPKIDGLEVLKRLKADSSTKDIAVVILSNLGQDELIKQALQTGAKAYIVKSLYTPAQVVAEVRSILGV